MPLVFLARRAAARARPPRVRLLSQPSAARGSPGAAPEPPQKGKVRQYFDEYGRPGIVVYIGVYLTTLASLYGAVDSGLLPGGDAVSLLRRIGADRVLPEGTLDKINPKSGSFATAWILAKFTEPFRFAFVVFITPRVVRMLKAFR